MLNCEQKIIHTAQAQCEISVCILSLGNHRDIKKGKPAEKVEMVLNCSGNLHRKKKNQKPKKMQYG